MKKLHAPTIVRTIAKKIFPKALRRRFGLSHGGAELTLAQARAEIRPLGLSIKKVEGGYRVSRKGVTGVAYESDDLRDAVESARRLAEQEPEDDEREEVEEDDELEGVEPA
jgi:hypothetical protein